MSVSVLTALRLTSSLVLDNDKGDFPANPLVGTMVIKSGSLYGYININQVTTWYPLVRLPERYVHNQTAPSDNFVVQHNLNTTEVWYQIQDSNGQLTTPAGFEQIDNNSFRLTFGEPVQCKVLALATGVEGAGNANPALSSIQGWPSAVSATEVGYLDGLTGGVQSQLNAIVAQLGSISGSTTLSGITDWPVAVTATEVGYLDGVTSSLQIQLDAKQTAAQVDARIQLVVGAAPAALDTLGEIAAQLAADETAATALTNAVSLKADQSYVDAGLSALNASNLTTGTVPSARLGTGTANNTVFLRGDGVWTAPTASIASSVAGTGYFGAYTGATGTYVGAHPVLNQPWLIQNNASAAVDAKIYLAYVDASGSFRHDVVNDAGGATVNFFKVDRSGTTVTNISLTSTAITLNGVVTGTSFAGNGASLTALNAGSLATGTVPSARRGSGTADATTYLRGDGVWATVAGGGGGGTPGGATTQIQYNNAGVFAGSPDFTFNSGTGVVSATGFSGNGAALTALNASNLTTGIVPAAQLGSGIADISTYLRGDGTWATLSSTATNLTATSSLAVNGLTTGTFVDVTSLRPYTTTVTPNAPAGARVTDYFINSTDGSLNWRLVADGNGTAANWMTVTRSGNTATNISLTATTLTFSGNFVNSILPSVDNSKTLGGAANRWSVVYAGSGTINTSDGNLKQDIAELDEVEKRVGLRLKALIRKYRFKDSVAEKGDAARIHVGAIAQDVEGAFILEGLDPEHYAVFCKDTWTDAEGVEQTRLGIRYDEMFAFIISVL